MKEEVIEYYAHGIKFLGRLYLPPDSHRQFPLPAVLVAHAWRGQDTFAQNKAKAMTELGYIGFAVDLYGNGISVSTDSEAGALMSPLASDRKILQERITAAYQALCQHSQVDKNKIGGIGFCFGGVAAIELLRSGQPVKGVVSFHAGLNAIPLEKVKKVPIAKGIKGSLLVLTGYEDPIATPEVLLDFQKELNEAGVDWQVHVYGHTTHAFTNPEANSPDKGLIYNSLADRRSWLEMKNFFTEIFNS